MPSAELPEPPARLGARRSRRRARPLEERTDALKERVYATFTGLAIVTVLAVGDHGASTQDAFLGLLAGILGITLAGFVADLIAHLVSHGTAPSPAEVRTMARVSLEALGSASIPLVALALAWIGWLDVEVALRIGVVLYIAVLGMVALLAVSRTGLPWSRRIVALGGLVGLGAVVVGVLVLAH